MIALERDVVKSKKAVVPPGRVAHQLSVEHNRSLAVLAKPNGDTFVSLLAFGVVGGGEAWAVVHAVVPVVAFGFGLGLGLGFRGGLVGLGSFGGEGWDGYTREGEDEKSGKIGHFHSAGAP